MTITNTELKQMNKLNIGSNFHQGGDIFIENDSTLIKATTEDIHKNVDYLTKIPDHKNVIKPLEEVQILNEDNNKKYETAYRMQFLNNAKTLVSLYKLDIPYEKKLKYAKDFFNGLKFLHQYLIVGDIHSKNLLVNDGNAYISDLDNFRKPKEIFTPIYCYYYLNALQSYGNNKYTDIIKMYIECLSLILEINFSKIILMYGYHEFYKIFTSYNLPDEVLRFFKVSKNKSNLKKLGEKAYDFERFINPEILELKRKLSYLEPGCPKNNNFQF